MPRILICPNAYKGSLTAAQAAKAIERGLFRAVQDTRSEKQGDRLQTDCLPLADGGDGILETLIAATDGQIRSTTVRGPLGSPVEAAWGTLGGSGAPTAVIEMAKASGLTLLRPEQRDPRRASTYGTGELMRAAIEAGCKRLIVGIGGSATNDGGAGMARALGAHLLDMAGRELEPGGAALANLARVDLADFCLHSDVEVIVACDVDNPLTGPEGASAVYGPQKGASPEMVTELDGALAHYALLLKEQIHSDVANVPGAGAAGGLGAGLLAFCHAELRSGLEMAMEVTRFDERLRQAQFAITGEGRLDGQTARGKVVAGVAQRAGAAGVPAIALAGSMEAGAEAALRSKGLTAAFCIADRPMTVEEAMQEAETLLSNAAERVMRVLNLF